MGHKMLLLAMVVLTMTRSGTVTGRGECDPARETNVCGLAHSAVIKFAPRMCPSDQRRTKRTVWVKLTGGASKMKRSQNHSQFH